MDGFLATVQIGVTLMGTLAGVARRLPGQPLRRAHAGADRRRPVHPADVVATVARGRRHRLRRADPGRAGAQGPGPALHRHRRPARGAAARPGWRASRAGWSRPDRAPRARVLLAVPACATPATARSCPRRRSSTSSPRGAQQGVLDQTEEELIHSVFEFSETPVKKVMVPRPKIFALDVNTPPGEVEQPDRGGRLLAHPRLRRLRPTTSSASSTSRTRCACWRGGSRWSCGRSCTPSTSCPRRRRSASC